MQAVSTLGYAGDARTGLDIDPVPHEFGMDEGTEFGVEGGQYLGGGLDLGDVDAAGGEAFGHLQADVAGADNQGGARLQLLEGVAQGEGVAHGVQQVDAVGGAEGVESGDRGTHGPGAGADHQRVVVDQGGGVVGSDGLELTGVDVDAGGARVEQQVQARGLQVGAGAVCQVVPVSDLAGDVVGDPADGEVRVGVGHHDGDLGRRVEFAGTQPRGDAGIAAADAHNVHGDVLSGRRASAQHGEVLVQRGQPFGSRGEVRPLAAHFLVHQPGLDQLLQVV
ncbi:hypothetical protein HMPREF1003_00597 [Propionibacterium sp. 5_U_42AFAA]|nr:hypothetical protein HMPREF1003_00597 [Propionibacterium sp. 5_U_42AFAA]